MTAYHDPEGNEVAEPMHWQYVLEAFATAPEACTWELKGMKLTNLQKYEATMYLVEKGLLEWAGRVRDEFCDNLYQITDAGRVAFGAGLAGLRRHGHARVKHSETTVAQRAYRSSPRDVFDLTRVPWSYSMRSEKFHEFEEAA